MVATEDGRETNIGNVCGKNHFGDEFQALRNRFESRRRIKDYREQLAGFKARLTHYRNSIQALRDEELGANWVHTRVESFRRHCPSQLIDDLIKRAKSNDGDVSEVVVLRGAEAERRLAAEGKLRERKEDIDREVTYASENLIGTISGLGIWRGQTIRHLLIDNLERRLIALEGVDIFSLSEAALRTWVQYVNSVEDLLREARILIEEGRQFFADANMDLLQYLRVGTQVLSDYRRRKWDNKAGKWRNPPA